MQIIGFLIVGIKCYLGLNYTEEVRLVEAEVARPSSQSKSAIRSFPFLKLVVNLLAHKDDLDRLGLVYLQEARDQKNDQV